MDDGLGTLRRWVVVVLLTLISFTTIIEVVDSVFGTSNFNTDPALYTLLGGVITGLFAAEVLAIYRKRHNGNGSNDGKGKDT